MDDVNRQEGETPDDMSAPEPTDAGPSDPAPPPPPRFDESLVEEAAALIDNTRTYAQAELGFQKTRARLAGKSVGLALVLAIIALILLHIAFLALAVGLVMALAPLMTIWGAIGIVFGGLLFLVALLVWLTIKRGKTLAAMFAADEKSSEP